MRKIILCAGALLLVACASNEQLAPVLTRNEVYQPPKMHRVIEGETLSEIARRYDLSLNALARANGLHKPYTVKPNDQINLEIAKSHKSLPPVKVIAKSEPKRISQPVVTQLEKEHKDNNNVINTVDWVWPAKGIITEKFSDKHNTKGIKIAGQTGSPIYATADGEVVYSGNNLRGYGNLLIIKHANNYLSAYAHNDKLLVAEGDKVKAGDKVAEMGNTEASDTMLHFELRYNGKPIDPLKLLPEDKFPA